MNKKVQFEEISAGMWYPAFGDSRMDLDLDISSSQEEGGVTGHDTTHAFHFISKQRRAFLCTNSCEAAVGKTAVFAVPLSAHVDIE